MDIDLNIENYNLTDILNLFQVRHDFNDVDLKNAKKKVLMLHPDKSKLEKEYFLFFTKAYKVLYQLYEFKQKTSKKYSDEYKDHVEETKSIHNFNSMFKNAGDFSSWFNKTFDELKLNDEHSENGYNDWMKETISEENNNIKSTSHMHQEIENRKQKLKQMVPYQGVHDITLNLSSGGTELDRSKKSYYGNTEIFSKLPYEDLKTAHTESIIPVSNEDYLNRKSYSSVDEYNNQRKQNIEIFSKDESEKILRQRKQKDEEYANKIAFQLLEKQELAEKNNKIFMSKLQRIGNK